MLGFEHEREIPLHIFNDLTSYYVLSKIVSIFLAKEKLSEGKSC